MSLFTTLESLWGGLFGSGVVTVIATAIKFGKKLYTELQTLRAKKAEERKKIEMEKLRQIILEMKTELEKPIENKDLS